VGGLVVSGDEWLVDAVGRLADQLDLTARECWRWRVESARRWLAEERAFPLGPADRLFGLGQLTSLADSLQQSGAAALNPGDWRG
jgi:hypothetical protein